MRNRIVLALVFLFLLVPESRSLQAAGGGAPPLTDPNEDPTGSGGALKPQIDTGGGYSAYNGNGTRVVNDLSVPGSLGAYGLDFTRYWNSTRNDYDEVHAEWNTDFGGSGWSHSWHWKAELFKFSEQLGDGGEQIFHTQIIITFPDGHTTKYKIVRSNRPHGVYWPLIALADPRLGPNYTPAERNSGWRDGGLGVHDHIDKMAEDGHEFWLSLADGGSVHFVWIPQGLQGYYQATEVFDPHGFKTELFYTDNYLTEVRQEGGRSLFLTWGLFNPDNWWVITKVETGGASTGVQRVTYRYTFVARHLVLLKATYENDPAPGQVTYARYSYGTCFQGGTEPCDPNGQTAPMLKWADDPHYSGAMTKIRYHYQGPVCSYPPIGQEFYPEWVPAEPYAIKAEISDAGWVVSSFVIDCLYGQRVESNGLGGSRKLYFGSSAGTIDQTVSPPLGCRGYQLGKITDFTAAPLWGGAEVPAGLPNRRQNFSLADPRHIWDARNPLPTKETVTPGDESGSPSQINYIDGSSRLYNHLDETGSEVTLHPTRMHNNNKRWLFWKRDELGQTTYYRRDTRRRITRIDYPDTSYETFEYDNNNPDGLNQVTRHRLPSGATETYVYHPNTHLLMEEENSVDGPAAKKQYEYDSLGRVLTMTDGTARNANPPAPFTVRMTYNGRHQVLTVEYASTTGTSPTVRYEYDDYGNCTAVTNELGHRSTYTYDSFRRCTSYTEPLNAPGWNGSATVASRRWDWDYGREIPGVGQFGASAHTSREWRIQVEPISNQDGQRRMTARHHDVNNRITAETTGLIATSLTTGVNGGDAETHYFTYDENGQKSSFTDPRLRITNYTYNNRNWLEKTIEHPIPGDTSPPRTTELHYDASGNKTLVIFPDQKTQQWLYYDAFGQPRLFVDERFNTTYLDYWPWGPMKKLAQVTTKRTNDNGQLENQLTAFFPGLTGRPWRTYFPDNSYEESTYQFGQLKESRTRRGQKKVIDQYDARGREKHHYWLTHDGAPDGSTPAVARVWDDANRLTSIANLWSTIEYGYDEAGQAKWEQSTVIGSSGPAARVTYFRYPSGEVSRVTYPNGTSVNRFYTARGQLKEANWGAGSTSYVYHPDGKVNSQSRSNGVTTNYEYDGRGMIWSLQHRNDAGGHDLARRDYHWRDDRDRILAWKRGTDRFYNEMEDGRGTRYKYDAEGQLEQAWYRALNPETEAPSDPKRGDEFHYDQLGNRMGWNTVASRGRMLFKRKNNGLNQYFSWENEYPNPPQHWGTTTNYDDDIGGYWGEEGEANGVLMEDGWITAGFNALNQPTGIWSKAFTGTANRMWFGYDPLGRCVKRWNGPLVGMPPNQQAPPANTNPATYLYYDGWNLVQEGLSAGTADRVYVHGGRVDEIVASLNGVWYNHHYDAQGNCILLSTTTGVVAEQYDYDAFGYPYFYSAGGGKGSGKTRFLFTGREWLSELRLYDYRNRMYHPELGRFLQPDPKHFEAGDYNLYRYCHNDPVNKSDPSGMTLVVDIADPLFFAIHNWALGQVAATPSGGPAVAQLQNSLNTHVITNHVSSTESAAKMAMREVTVPTSLGDALREPGGGPGTTSGPGSGSVGRINEARPTENSVLADSETAHIVGHMVEHDSGTASPAASQDASRMDYGLDPAERNAVKIEVEVIGNRWR